MQKKKATPQTPFPTCSLKKAQCKSRTEAVNANLQLDEYLRFSPRQYFQVAGNPLGFLANRVDIQSGKLFFKSFIIITPLILQHCR